MAALNSFRKRENPSRTRELKHDFLLHIGISPSLRHLNLQLSEFAQNGSFNGCDLAWVPNAQLVVASRPSRNVQRQLGLRGMPRFRENPQSAARASESRQFVRQGQTKIVLYANHQMIRSAVYRKA